MNPVLRVSCLDGHLRTTCGTLRRGVALLALAALTACSPVMDWREVSLPETPLRAQLPCRPGTFQRDVVVAGSALKLFMLSCEAGGVTFGVASADVADPTHVDAVLAGLADAARHALRGARGDFVAFDLPGGTPFRGTTRARLRGDRPDGVPVDESLRLFARGTRVYQVSAVGASLDAAALAPFEDGLRFDLEKSNADPR